MLRNFLWSIFFLLIGCFIAEAQSPENGSQKVFSPKFRIAIDGGFGYLTGNTQTSETSLIEMGNEKDRVEKYYKNLKIGTQAAFSLHYLLKENFGFGLDYHLFSNRSQMTGTVSDQTSTYYGVISERIYTNFIGPSFFMHHSYNSKINLYTSIALGWTFYRDELHFIVAPALIKGGAPGMHCNLGFEIPLFKHISAGIEISGFYAELKKFTLSDGQTTTDLDLKDQKENLTRLNLSTGIHYSF